MNFQLGKFSSLYKIGSLMYEVEDRLMATVSATSDSTVTIGEVNMVLLGVLDSVKFLKVKVKSLTAEARIIRLEEQRSTGSLRDALCLHRRGVVRQAARESQLAYGFLRGRTYHQMERNAEHPPVWKNVYKMVVKYGTTLTSEKVFQKWHELGDVCVEQPPREAA